MQNFLLVLFFGLGLFHSVWAGPGPFAFVREYVRWTFSSSIPQLDVRYQWVQPFNRNPILPFEKVTRINKYILVY